MRGCQSEKKNFSAYKMHSQFGARPHHDWPEAYLGLCNFSLAGGRKPPVFAEVAWPAGRAWVATSWGSAGPGVFLMNAVYSVAVGGYGAPHRGHRFSSRRVMS